MTLPQTCISLDMDFYVILGVERGATLGRHQARVQAARAEVSSGHQSGRPDGRGAVPADRGGVRNAERSGSPAALRHHGDHGRRRRRSHLRLRGIRFLGQRARQRGVRPSAICSPTCSGSATRGAATATPERGVDLHQTITLDVRGGDARRPARRSRSRGRSTAATCQRRGPAERRRDAVPALPRHGRREVGARAHGVLEAVRATAAGRDVSSQTRCPACGGQQVEMRTETLTINVPPGLADGARIRVPGKGHVGPQRRRERRPLHHRPRAAASACSGATATICT